MPQHELRVGETHLGAGDTLVVNNMIYEPGAMSEIVHSGGD